MADISKELNDIMAARYGKDVRQSIHDGIEKVNDVVEEAGYDTVLNSLLCDVVILSGYLNFVTGTRTLSYIPWGEQTTIQIISPKLKGKSLNYEELTGLPLTLPDDNRAYIVYLDISTFTFLYKDFSKNNYQKNEIPLFLHYSTNHIHPLRLSPISFYINNDPFYKSRYLAKEKLNILLNKVDYNPKTHIVKYLSDTNNVFTTFSNGNTAVYQISDIDNSGFKAYTDGSAVVIQMDLLTGYLGYIGATSRLTNDEYRVNLFVIYEGVVYPLALDPSAITINGIPYYDHIRESKFKSIDSMINGLITSDTSDKFKIVLGGDSITHGVGGTGFSQNGETIINNFKRNPDGYCWANLFKKYIEDNYNATVTNNACTGTNSSFWNVNKGTLIPKDTDLFILTIGTNDRNINESDPDTKEELIARYKNNLKWIIEYCNENNIDIILASPIPASSTDESTSHSGVIRKLHSFQINEVVQEIASDYNMEYINMYNLLYYYYWEKDLDFEDYFADGLHPNDSMYKVMFYLYLKGLNLAPSYIPVE